MKEPIIEPFVDGFIGAFRFVFDLFVAVATAVAAVWSDFVNQTPPRSAGKKRNV